MRVPTEAELAAIAAAYLLVTQKSVPEFGVVPSRWRVAARVAATEPLVDAPSARAFVRASLWRAAGRA
jgi:hypothetical protein